MRQIFVLVAVLGAALLGLPGAAHASQDITVTGYTTCSHGGVRVTNPSGQEIEVRLYLDGAPAFAGDPWITVSGGQTKLIAGPAPASGSGTYTTYLKGAGASEQLLATTHYVTPAYCNNFVVTYSDSCDIVKVTITNNHGSDETFTIAQTAGTTYPVAYLSVPAGATKSVDIAITAVIYEIGLYLQSAGDYIDRYKPKGVGNCASPAPSASPSMDPSTGPSPSPSAEPTPGASAEPSLEPSASPSPGLTGGPSESPAGPSDPATPAPSSPPGSGLPVTGSPLTAVLLLGLTLTLLGLAALLTTRRIRLRVR